MFLIVLVLLALGIGLQRGSLRYLADIPLRGVWIPLAAFTLQALLVHFPVVSPSASARIGPLVIVVSYAAVVVFLALNRRQPGAKLAALGACLNLAVMLANGGYMPVTVAALERSGHLDRRVVRGDGVYVYGSKDVVLPDSDIRLGFLADSLSLPRPIPLAASFSFGDLLIAAGVSTFAYKAVSRPRAGTGAASPGAGGSVQGGSGGFEGKGDHRRGGHVGRQNASVDRPCIDRPALQGVLAAKSGGGDSGPPVYPAGTVSGSVPAGDFP
jgi:hypothetical protein